MWKVGTKNSDLLCIRKWQIFADMCLLWGYLVSIGAVNQWTTKQRAVPSNAMSVERSVHSDSHSYNHSDEKDIILRPSCRGGYFTSTKCIF